MHRSSSTGNRSVRSGARPSRQGSARGLRAPMALAALSAALLLAGCAGQSSRDAEGGGDYRRLDPSSIPDAVPRVEPRSKYGNMASYRVRGRTYYTKADAGNHVEYGLASWYGKKFNGRRTSSGEPYDMYGMTAAHKTLPLPSYARVTNLENGQSTVVRINDRGPFHSTRVIDLSYAAATKIGVFPKGTATVEIRGIDPGRPDEGGPAVRGGAAPVATPGPFVADARSGGDFSASQATALDRSMAIAGRGSAPPRRASSGFAPARERAATAAFAAVDAEPIAVFGPAGESQPVVPVRAAYRVPKAAAPVRNPVPDPVPDPVPASAPVAASSAASGSALYLQVGAFGDPRNAQRLRERLRPHLAEAVMVQNPSGGAADLYKVRVGPLASEGEARRLSAKLASLGVSEAPRLVWN